MANKEKKQEKKYTGFIEAPYRFDKPSQQMLPDGVDLYQCPDCGEWLNRKMTPEDEERHNRRCNG